jgi:hypothetical protein
MRGCPPLVMFALVATAAVSGWAHPSAAQSPISVVSIGIYDYADVPSEQLSRARQAVSRLFAAIDVRIAWLGPYRTSHLQPHTRFEPHTRTPDLAVLILDAKMTRALGPQAHSLGCAPGTALERGRIAYVFYGRLTNVVWSDEGVVKLLSLVIAHEIGHLLLPYGSHSDTGVMRSRWSVTELRRVDLARVGFTSSQVEAIRRRLFGNDAGDRHATNLNWGDDWSDGTHGPNLRAQRLAPD